MGKFEVYKSEKSEEYYFRLKAGNGQTILVSEGYSTKAACLNGVQSVKTNAPDDKRYDLLESKNGKFYFNLKAGNGQIIGKSEMYETAASRANGVESVKNNADSDVVEL